MKILAIETSCDETSAAIVEENKKGQIKVLADFVSSQVKEHAKYGGVVPEVAARMHIDNILPVIEFVFKKAKLKPEKIDAIAVTYGPGLMPALLVGVETAKSLAYAWKKPLIKINHLEGHLWAVKAQKSKVKSQKIKSPVLGLIVSGGHTQLVYFKNYGKYKIIGQTVDDAVGEAFDKVAKMLGLGYPGGPVVSALADKARKQENKKTTKQLITLPRPMIHSKDYNFSFSGLKTAVLYGIKKLKIKNSKIKGMVCAEFQQAVIDVLNKKTLKAAKEFKVKTVILGGGVSANKELRRQLALILQKELPEVEFLVPELKYTGDNATMIGLAAIEHFKIKDFVKLFDLSPEPNLEL